LEKQLWEERLAIQKKHENKVKVAQTKSVYVLGDTSPFIIHDVSCRAALIGAGISQHEADVSAALPALLLKSNPYAR
jgi:hypothetical protein